MIRIQKFYQADERNFPFSWSNPEIPSSAYQQKETPIEKAAIKASTPTSPKEEQTPMNKEMIYKAINWAIEHYKRYETFPVGDEVDNFMESYASQFKDGKEAVEFAEWRNDNFINFPQGYYSAFNDGSHGKSHISPKLYTLSELYTIFLNTQKQ